MFFYNKYNLTKMFINFNNLDIFNSNYIVYLIKKSGFISFFLKK